MEKTFETPGGVRPLRIGDPGGAGDDHRPAKEIETVVSLVADKPGAEDLVERATVECRPSGGRDHLVAVKLPSRARPALPATHQR